VKAKAVVTLKRKAASSSFSLVCSAGLGGRLFDLGRRAGAHHDVGARVGTGEGRRGADAAAGTGDDGHPSVEAEAVENAGHVRVSSGPVAARCY
jgi:hypothetical protein